MAKKRNTDFTTSSWDFLGQFLEDVSNEVHDDLNVGLEKATDYLANEFEKKTPVDTGITKASWVKQMKYRNVKYINNTATDKKGNPIINILEFATKKGKPFVRKTLDENEEKIKDIILSEMSKGEQK